MCESVFHSSSTEADRHTVRQHRDPSSEPLSFVAARPTYIGRWKFRLKCIQLRKALRSLLSQITKLIWLPWTEVFASIMWLCNCALWPSKRAFITAIAQEKTYLFRIAHTLRWWCEMNTKFFCFFWWSIIRQNLQSTTALLLSTGCICYNYIYQSKLFQFIKSFVYISLISLRLAHLVKWLFHVQPPPAEAPGSGPGLGPVATCLPLCHSVSCHLWSCLINKTKKEL